MNRWGRRLSDVVAREPAVLGTVILAWVAVLSPSQAVMVAATGTVGWLVRLLSKSKRSAAEDMEIARYVGALEGEDRTPVPEVPARHLSAGTVGKSPRPG